MLIGMIIVLAHLFQVVSGTERVAIGRQHHHPNRLIPRNPVERVTQFIQQLLRQGVVLGGAVKRQRRDAVFAGVQQHWLGLRGRVEAGVESGVEGLS